MGILQSMNINSYSVTSLPQTHGFDYMSSYLSLTKANASEPFKALSLYILNVSVKIF
jgi:hypothetical protein